MNWDGTVDATLPSVKAPASEKVAHQPLETSPEAAVLRSHLHPRAVGAFCQNLSEFELQPA